VIEERERPPGGRRHLALTAIRAVASATVTLALLFVLPLDHEGISPVVALVIVLAALAVLTAYQVRSILRSPWPGVRAAAALATSVPLLLTSFSAVYFMFSQDDVHSFSEPLSRSSALYFTVTVFSTVGFGDITPRSDTARMLVSGQMIVDLLLLGVVFKVLFGAVQVGRQRRATEPQRP
jgi:4-amino-4-deoxy-L-arabinose transferase-like glycosyltransferase